MAALERIRFVPFAVPPSNPPFCNRNTLAYQTSRSVRSLKTSGGQKKRKSADPLSRSGYQADRNGAARAQDSKRALADNDDESDDRFPSLEELSRAALSSKISTEASKTGCTLQRLEQPAVDSVGLQVNPTQSGLGECQYICQDQPVILDDNNANNAGAGNEVEGASGDIDTGHIGRNAGPHIIASSELVSTPTASINTSGPWYDVEETYYVNEPAPGPRPHEQRGVPATLAQSQLQTVPRSSTPLQDQISQQDIDNITQSTSMESAPRTLPKPSDNGNDGWTDDSMAELEKELGLAVEELQVESSSAGTPTSPSPRSAEAPPDGIQSRECTETTSSRPEELQDTSRNGTAHVLEEWELQETEAVVEGGPVAMQQQKELGDPDVGDQDLVEVVDADDPEYNEATEILLAAEPKIPDEHRFRLRGIRTQHLAGRQTKTTQYRIVWGDRLNRSDSWFKEEDIRISMLRPSCERSSQDSVLPVERDVSRVHRMRLDKRSKGKKTFEYLVDEPRTWITEDQLRISLSPMLVAELKASSPHPLSDAQRDVLLRHSATLISDEYRHASPASRSSTPANPAPVDEPLTRRKRGHQDTHTETSSAIDHCASTDNKRVSGNPRLANRQQSPPNLEPSPEPSHNEAGSRIDRDSDDQLNGTESDNDNKDARPMKRKRPSSCYADLTRKKARHTFQHKPLHQHRLLSEDSEPHRYYPKSQSPQVQRSITATSSSTKGRLLSPAPCVLQNIYTTSPVDDPSLSQSSGATPPTLTEITFRPHSTHCYSFTATVQDSDGQGVSLGTVIQLIASIGHVGEIEDFTIKPVEQHSYLLSGFSRHISSLPSPGRTILSATSEASRDYVDVRCGPQDGRAVASKEIDSQRSEPSSSDNDEEESSDRDIDLGDDYSSEDQAGHPGTRTNVPWDRLDELRLLAYRKEQKSWDWILTQFPGRTERAVRQRVSIARNRGK